VVAPAIDAPIDVALVVDAAVRTTVTITIDGVPAGTEVRVAGTLLGVAPRIDLPRGTAEVQLVFARAGFQARSISVTPDRDQHLTVRLQPVARRPGENDMLEFPR
jgi:hypothetical protein